MQGKNIEHRFPPAPSKKKNFVLKGSKDKKLINYTQLAEKYALSVKNLFFSHSHVLTSQKLLQKRRSGKKCWFFVTKMVVLKS